jgi:hypothetical protein
MPWSALNAQTSTKNSHNAFFTAGLAHGSIPGYGVGYGYLFRPNLKILGEFVHSYRDFSNDYKAEYIETEKLDVTGQDLSIKAQYFLGQSFYLSGGFGHRSLRIAAHARSQLSDVSAEGEIASSSFVGQMGLGNEWKITDHFTLGCQWIGFSVPLTSSSASKLNASYEDDPQFAETKDDLNKLSKTMGSTTTMQLLMLNAGILF